MKTIKRRKLPISTAKKDKTKDGITIYHVYAIIVKARGFLRDEIRSCIAFLSASESRVIEAINKAASEICDHMLDLSVDIKDLRDQNRASLEQDKLITNYISSIDKLLFDCTPSDCPSCKAIKDIILKDKK